MKKRMRQLAALGLATIMVLSGCSEKKEEENIAPITPEEEVVETVVPDVGVEEMEEPIPLSVNIATNNKTYYFEGGEDAYLYLQYCDVEIEGDEYTNLERNVENWSLERSEGLRSLYADFEESAALEAEGDEEFYGYSLYHTLAAARADGQVLSLKDDTYQYGGGAHGVFYREGVNFDSKSGKKLSLRDIISDWDNFAEDAAAHVTYYLKEHYSGELFADYATTVENLWAQEAEPEWYLDGSSIVIVIQEYMVGPYAMGTPEIHLSYAEFAPYIKDAYLPGTGDGMAEFKVNQELFLKLPGDYEEVPMMLQYEVTEENINCSLWLGENEKPMDGFIALDDAYLLRNGEEIYCLIEVDVASDDYETYIYRLTEGVIEEIAKLGASVAPGNVNSEQVVMESWVYLLGTYGGVKTYHFDENHAFVTEDTEYVLHRNDFVLTTTVDLPVALDEAESVLPAGSHIVLNATDGETYVKFTIQETGQTGVLNVERNENDYYNVTINGMNENDCFEFLPYAG